MCVSRYNPGDPMKEGIGAKYLPYNTERFIGEIAMGEEADISAKRAVCGKVANKECDKAVIAHRILSPQIKRPKISSRKRARLSKQKMKLAKELSKPLITVFAEMVVNKLRDAAVELMKEDVLTSKPGIKVTEGARMKQFLLEMGKILKKYPGLITLLYPNIDQL